MQTVCNSCGTLLFGKHGIEQVKKPHIYIKGRICLQNLGEKDHQYHIFVTQVDDEETTVCNVDCLNDYLGMKKTQFKKTREAKLRAEASDPSYHHRQYLARPANR